MRILAPVRWIPWVGFGAAIACSTEAAKPVEPDAPVAQDVAKIDPGVLAQLGGSAPVDVILLGTDQWLLGPDALAEFATVNEGSPRSALRTTGIDRLRAIASAQHDTMLDGLETAAFVRRLWIVNAVSIRLSPDDVRLASLNPAVRYIYPTSVNTADYSQATTVGTVLAGQPVPFSDEGKEVAWNVIDIGAQEAWNDLSATGEGVVIQLMDSGIEYTHTDLRDRVWRNADEVPNNGIDDDSNGYIDDLYGYDWSRGSAEVTTRGQAHGAYVSGILVGDGSGGIVTGVAPGARVMAATFGTDTGAALAFEYALTEGADVVNMSFSIPNLGERRGLWRLMADHATAAGLVLVSGAGNFAQSAPIPVQLRIPEGIPSVLAVGGVSRTLEPVAFSSGGPVEWGSVSLYGDHPLPDGLTKPDVAAFPGPDFAIVDPAGGYVNPNPSIRGNSFSGPQAAGVAALVLSARPELPAWRVKEILEESAVDLGEPGKDNRTGWGLLDAAAAVRVAQNGGGS